MFHGFYVNLQHKRQICTNTNTKDIVGQSATHPQHQPLQCSELDECRAPHPWIDLSGKGDIYIKKY